MTDEREPGGRIDAPVAAAGPGGDGGAELVADPPALDAAGLDSTDAPDTAGPPLQPVRPWLKQGTNGSGPAPLPEAVSPTGVGPAPTRQWSVVDRPSGTRPDPSTRPEPGTRPSPGTRPTPLGAGPAPSNEESVLAALRAGTGDPAELRVDPGVPVPVTSDAAAATVTAVTAVPSAPAGRLRRARRWLFEQAPPDGPEAGNEAAEVQAGPSTAGDSAAAGDGATFEAVDDAPDEAPDEAVDDAPEDAPDDGWTVAELAALRADVEPERDAPVADRTVDARGELARRLAAIHDDPEYDPAAAPVEGSEVRPTVAWDDLAAAAPAEVAAAPVPTTAVPEPGPEQEPRTDPAPEAPGEPAAPSASDEEFAPPAAVEGSAQRRPRPRPYAGAPVHFTDEPLPEVAPQRPVEPAAAAPVRGRPAAASSRPEEPAAQEKLEKGGPVRGRRTARWLIRTAVLVAIAVVTAVLLRAYVVSPYYIPSASMEPTLHGCSGCNNDHVLVDKLSYRMHDVHRGDVVVFHRPATWQVPEKTLIKRVVGLPGDRLAVRDGNVYVNGLQLQESYLNADCPPMTSLSEDPGSPVRTYGPVPPGDLYVMGDNRCDSADSRAFGPVPTSDVIGRAFVIIWPLGRIHWL